MNNVVLSGLVIGEVKFSHECYDEKFYKFTLDIKRDSGVSDQIPILASEKLFIPEKIIGRFIEVTGDIRTYNDENAHLVVNVFAQDIVYSDEVYINRVQLSGSICKKYEPRKTPKGRRICDFTLAANRVYGKADYIPCICWGRDAVSIAGFVVGDKISCIGRIQSREYEKNGETKTTYEVSISKIEKGAV